MLSLIAINGNVHIVAHSSPAFQLKLIKGSPSHVESIQQHVNESEGVKRPRRVMSVTPKTSVARLELSFSPTASGREHVDKVRKQKAKREKSVPRRALASTESHNPISWLATG